jgi:hypothetical protein
MLRIKEAGFSGFFYIGVRRSFPECQLLVGVGSMTFAQPSVGAAATAPTIGTIFSPADVTRHGAANKPQPLSNKVHAATNAARLIKFMVLLPSRGKTFETR